MVSDQILPKLDQLTAATAPSPTIIFLKSIEGRKQQLLINMAGQPCLRLPGPPEAVVALRSPRARSWLAAEAWRITGEVLSSGQVNQVLPILEDFGWNSIAEEPFGPQLWQRIAVEPIVQSVLGFMEGRNFQEFHGSMTELLKGLTTEAQARGISMGVRWPRIPAILSAILSEQKDLLAAVGFDITWSRTNKARSVTITPLLPYELSDHGDYPVSYTHLTLPTILRV